MHRDNIIARFMPKKLDTLRYCMFVLIGQEFEWEYAGEACEDESYPGQVRWMMVRRHDPEIPEECRGRWVPDEDLEMMTDQSSEQGRRL